MTGYDLIRAETGGFFALFDFFAFSPHQNPYFPDLWGLLSSSFNRLMPETYPTIFSLPKGRLVVILGQCSVV